MPRTQFYLNYIQSDKWYAKRAKIIEKRGYVCESCSSTHQLQLHHLTYDRLGHELDEDLLLLCKACHETADRVRVRQTRYRNARTTYIEKKYGDDPPEGADEEFDEWLERKRESDY